MEKVVSGLRPTGPLHLGNYFGAIRNFLKLQEKEDCFFFVADLHSLTTHPNADSLQQNNRQLLTELLACGVDPNKCTMYVQSDVREIPELYLYFNMLAYKGELERVATFKDKARKQPDNINAGLLTYPVLMSVDIIIHKATKVPVGQDQEQHLEMTRNFARRFNNLYGELFPEPEAYNFGEKLVRIPGLDGSGKMGKSEGEKNAVYLGEDPKAITKKVMRAVTDTGPAAPDLEITPAIQNLFTLLEAVSSPETVQQYKAAYADTSIRYGDMKKQLAEDIVNFTAPIRERILELSKKPERIAEIREAGAAKARESARKTVAQARKLIGLAQ